MKIRTASVVGLLLVLYASACGAAVAFDASCASGDASNPNPQTCSITLGAGTKGVAVLITFHDPVAIPTVSSVTVGADSLSLVSSTSVTTGTTHGEIWGGTTTQTGAKTVTVNYSGGTNYVSAIGAISATGIDTGTPLNNGTTTTGTTAPVSLAMTSPAGDLTTTYMFAYPGVGAATTNQTALFTAATIYTNAFDRGPGTANPTHTWDSWSGGLETVITGVNFKASSGASAAGAGVNGPILKGLVNGGLVQ